jgi:hypothetical protein
MRILGFNRSPSRDRKLAADIAQLQRARRRGGRVCGDHCNVRCPQCGSTSCLCRCTPDCPDAARALSTEPDRYPIEPAILPLVFAMKRSGIFDPCWSCDGHLGVGGSIWKSPMVWFYCRSMLYLRLLGDGLNRMAGMGCLRVQWGIAVTYSDPGNPETAFSLQPAPGERRDFSLADLQADAGAIARALDPMMEESARALIR